MSGLSTLIKFAKRRTEGALTAWQRLRTERDDAKRKLSLLQRHREGYRDVMRAALERGMAAGSMMAHLGFIGQIEAILVRQQTELGNLEEACEQQWRELVEARREQRMYEILHERAAGRETEAEARRGQSENDELLQRAAAQVS